MLQESGQAPLMRGSGAMMGTSAAAGIQRGETVVGDAQASGSCTLVYRTYLYLYCAFLPSKNYCGCTTVVQPVPFASVAGCAPVVQPARSARVPCLCTCRAHCRTHSYPSRWCAALELCRIPVL